MKELQLITWILISSLVQCISQVDPAAVDRIVKASAESGYFEGTVLIAENGEPVYAKSFGFKDAYKQKPIKPDTHFGIASITKMITAIIVLQLAEEGKIRLSDDLDTLLPDFEIPEASKITLHHLLLHISGLPVEKDEIYLTYRTPAQFVRETIGTICKLPGFGKFNYANIDYVLLGLVVESIEKKSWQEVVGERIIKKLYLQNTGFLSIDTYPENFARTFSYDDHNGRISDPLFHIENYYAAGCMFSTVNDLLQIDKAMADQTLLKVESKELMFRSYPEYNYSGYSVWTYRYPFVESKPKIMERRGGILGANAVLIRFLDLNKTIIILSNTNRFNPDSFGEMDNLRESLIILLGEASH